MCGTWTNLHTLNIFLAAFMVGSYLVSATKRCPSPTRESGVKNKTDSSCILSLKPNSVMRRNDRLCSLNAFYQGYLDERGTFVVKDKNQMIIFSSGKQGDRLEFRPYGNLELFDNSTLKWASNTYGKMADLTLTDSGWLTMHDHEGNVRWQSHQCIPISADIQSWCALPYTTAWYPNLLLRTSQSSTKKLITKLTPMIRNIEIDGRNTTACWLLFQPCVDGVPILPCDDMCIRYAGLVRTVAEILFGVSWWFRESSCNIFPDGLRMGACTKIDEKGMISFCNQNGTNKQPQAMVNASWTTEYDLESTYVRTGLSYGASLDYKTSISLSSCLNSCIANVYCKELSYTFNGYKCWQRYMKRAAFLPMSSVFNVALMHNRLCLNKPCKNGGTCRPTEKDFTCICPSGYYGKLCDDQGCINGIGKDYFGSVDVTLHSKTCASWVNANGSVICWGDYSPQYWKEQYNYCRNPCNRNELPYCYVEDAETGFRREKCDVPDCEFCSAIHVNDDKVIKVLKTGRGGYNNSRGAQITLECRAPAFNPQKEFWCTNRKWQPSNPECSISCEIPTNDSNAEYRHIAKNIGLFPSNRVPEDQIVQHSCKSGYHNGHAIFRSLCNCGKWTPPFEDCEPVEVIPLLEAVSGSSSVVLLVVILILVLGIRFRKTVKVLVYDYSGWRIRRDQVDQAERLYDVFISHSNSNADFAINTLLPALEKHGFKLCIHQRDFEIGAAVSDNIVYAISNSQRVIVLLSPDFIGSEWCMFEFQQAVYQAVHERKSQVIMIMYETVDLSKIHKDDHTLKMYIQAHTYLERDDPLFWKRLFYAMPKVSNVAPGNLQNDNETIGLNLLDSV